MNEDDLRQLLRRTATDPGPRESWGTFLQIARRRRRLRRAAAGGAAAALAVAVLGGVALTSGIDLDGDPKPAATESPPEEAPPDDGVRRDDRGDDGTLRAGPGPRRGPRGSRAGRPPRPGGLDSAIDALGDGRREDDPVPNEPVPPDPGATGRCGAEAATITGTGGRDRLQGTAGADVIAAGAGDDVVTGGGGGDRICGGGGDDRIDGGAGFDLVVFSDSAARVEVYLRAGTATGDGDDALAGFEGAVGTAYDDWIEGDQFPNVLAGGAGADIMDGNGGEDVVLPGPGNDLASGGVGRDTLAFADGGWTPGRPGVHVDVRRGQSLGEGDDDVPGFEHANGTAGDDVFSGHSGPNVFRGYAGDDTASGLDGDDDLLGGPGSDKLDGGLGEDLLEGGDGIDTCTNGESNEGCEAGTFAFLLLAAAAALESLRRTRRRASRCLTAPRTAARTAVGWPSVRTPGCGPRPWSGASSSSPFHWRARNPRSRR